MVIPSKIGFTARAQTIRFGQVEASQPFNNRGKQRLRMHTWLPIGHQVRPPGNTSVSKKLASPHQNPKGSKNLKGARLRQEQTQEMERQRKHQT